MSESRRRHFLFGALAVTIVLTAASGKGSKDVEDTVAPSPARSMAKAPAAASSDPAAQTVPRIELERLRPPRAPVQDELPAGNTFAAASWHVPAPEPPKRVAKPLPPPAPAAPPVPFSFMGRYEDAGVLTFLLVKGDRLYTVAAGDVIENTYRVEGLAGNQLEVTYLPLATKQAISAGGT